MSKKVFLGFDLQTIWQDEPKGRIIEKKHRHLTLVFIGRVEDEELFKLRNSLTPLPFKFGPVAFFDEILFLKNVICYHLKFLTKRDEILALRDFFLKKLKIVSKKKEFLAHVTVSREVFPEKIKEWMCEVGFKNITINLAERIVNPKFGYEVLKSSFLKKHNTSQLILLSDEEYNSGLEKIKSDIIEAELLGVNLKFEVDISIFIVTGLAF